MALFADLEVCRDVEFEECCGQVLTPTDDDLDDIPF
jgi:hypothetical protein